MRIPLEMEEGAAAPQPARALRQAPAPLRAAGDPRERALPARLRSYAPRVQPRVKPRLRGLSHELAFYLALPLGGALVLEADTGRGRAAAAVFAASVA